MQEDPRLNRNKVDFPRLNIYKKNQYSQPQSTQTKIISEKSYLCKIIQTITLRINLILVLIIDKIKYKLGSIKHIFKFTAFLCTEVESFDSSVNDWELKRHFERI